MAKSKLSVVKGILKKLGIEFSSKISGTRAKAKLERAIEKEGIPEDVDLSKLEIKLLETMGYEIEFEEIEEKEVEEVEEDEVEEKEEKEKEN